MILPIWRFIFPAVIMQRGCWILRRPLYSGWVWTLLSWALCWLTMQCRRNEKEKTFALNSRAKEGYVLPYIWEKMNFYALKLKSWKLEVTHSFELDYLCTVPAASLSFIKYIFPYQSYFFRWDIIKNKKFNLWRRWGERKYKSPGLQTRETDRWILKQGRVVC